jgi:transcriptional regulator with XRE-family HTH domain
MFWENFCDICKNAGTTPSSVLAKTGIASGSVTKWKNGAIPSKTSLQKIADYFGINPQDFFVKKEKPAELGELSEGEAIWLDAYRRLPQDARNAILGVLNEFGDIAPSLQGPVLELIRVALKGADNSAGGLGSGYDVCTRQDKAE